MVPLMLFPKIRDPVELDLLCLGSPKVRCLFGGVLMIRIVVFGDVFWGTPFSEDDHLVGYRVVLAAYLFQGLTPLNSPLSR